MKWKILFISINLLPLLGSAQVQNRVSMRFQSSAYSLSVTPEEALIVSTKAGEVAMADSATGDWRSCNPVPGNVSMPGITFDQNNFFNRDTGFVSGFISNDSKYNIIYHTADGGKSWKKVDFALDGWADATSNLDNGEAWMSIGGKGIAYTKDFGYTWQALNVADVKQRYSSIFFNARHEGIIGALWNLIAYTNDNCQHWQLIPTPLDQHKYTKTDKARRPEISQVAIYNDYFLVSQESMVFYSKRDSINWVQLPEYFRFYTDPATNAIFFYRNDGKFVRADKHFSPLFIYDETFSAADAFCRNGSLFVMDGDAISQLTSDNTMKHSPMLTSRIGDVEPEYFAYDENGMLGILGNMVYKQPSDRGEWKYLFTLPVEIQNRYSLSRLNAHTLVYRKSLDTVYYYDMESKSGYFTSIDNMLKDFGKKNITEISFSKGSQGCFHNDLQEIIYTLKREDYVVSDKRKSGSKRTVKLKPDVAKMAGDVVNKFADGVCQQYKKQAVISDLEFSEDDYEQCRKSILEFQTTPRGANDFSNRKAFYLGENNINFQRLLAAVDKVKNIDSVSLNAVWPKLARFTSTTTNWIKVTLTALDGTRLEVMNAASDENAMYFPWIININGASVRSVSPDITAFVRAYCPSIMEEKDKVPILQALVKQIYQ